MSLLSMRSPWRLAGATVALSLLVATACDDDDDDGTSPAPVATTIEISSGNNQTVAVSTASQPLVVTVLDQNDNPMSGVQVTWAVATGEGTLDATTSTTGNNGTAQAIFTAGATEGPATVTATAGTLQPVTFNITVGPATPPPPPAP